MDTQILKHSIGDKSIIWFSTTNQYVVLENRTAEVLLELHRGKTHQEISSRLAVELRIPIREALDFTEQIKAELYLPNSIKKIPEITQKQIIKTQPVFKIIKYYKINTVIFKIDYESEFEVCLIHPKFAHLEVSSSLNWDYNYQIYTKNEIIFFMADRVLIGKWHKKEAHYFQGKCSMFIVQHIYKKKEDEWLGVFHASGVGNNYKSLLLLGNSGNGKSTSLAILQANGLTCLADDFVPVDVKNQHIYMFPSAISIKRSSLETLLPLYPELKNSAEFHFRRLQKTVRFLPPEKINYATNLPCNDLVFIKYKKDTELIFNSISGIEAFEQLIPDSWISDKTDNVRVFLDWFSQVNCYQLTYSDNDKMVNTIKGILSR